MNLIIALNLNEFENSLNLNEFENSLNLKPQFSITSK